MLCVRFVVVKLITNAKNTQLCNLLSNWIKLYEACAIFIVWLTIYTFIILIPMDDGNKVTVYLYVSTFYLYSVQESLRWPSSPA